MNKRPDAEFGIGEGLACFAIFLLFAGWLVYDLGFAAGLHRSATLAYVLCLFYLIPTWTVDALHRRFSPSRVDYLCLAIICAYVSASLLLAWPALVPISVLVSACGIFMGIVLFLRSK